MTTHDPIPSATEATVMIHRSAALLLAIVAFALPGSVEAVSCSSNVTPSTPDEDFQIDADGTAQHLPTGLMWMRCDLGQTWTGTTCSGNSATFTSWGAGMRTVRDINAGVSDLDGDGAAGFAGHVDWRVPNIKEWLSIRENCRHTPALNNIVFPNAPLAASHYSSTTDDKSPMMVWRFDTQFGSAGLILKDDNIPRFMRLVRGGHRGGDYAPIPPLFSDGFEGP